MHILFIETTNSTPHLETSLELAKIHLDRGDDVVYRFIGHSVNYSEFVKKNFIGTKSPELIGLNLIRTNNLKYSLPRFKKKSYPIPNFNTVEDLKNFKYKGYSAGVSALSSLVSNVRLSNLDIKKYPNKVKSIISSGIAVYEYALQEMATVMPDCVYLFNGRYANNRAIIDAAEELGIRYIIHERGANKDKYIAQSYLPHDFEMVQKKILEKWDAVNNSDAEEISTNFFMNNRLGIEQSWKSFIHMQEKGMVSNELAKKRKLITYYASSEDEYVAIGEIIKWDRWKNQISAVNSLISIIAKHQDKLALVIRMHPHLIEKNHLEMNPWMELKLPPNAQVILPNDRIDTYAQIEESDLVVTVGSTVGIESVYWGTPSICLGPSLYSKLNAVYLPKNDKELEAMLLSDSLIADKTKALPYGYYMATFGEEFIHYKAKNLFEGKFLNINLQSNKTKDYVRRIIKIFYQGNKKENKQL